MPVRFNSRMGKKVAAYLAKKVEQNVELAEAIADIANKSGNPEIVSLATELMRNNGKLARLSEQWRGIRYNNADDIERFMDTLEADFPKLLGS